MAAPRERLLALEEEEVPMIKKKRRDTQQCRSKISQRLQRQQNREDKLRKARVNDTFASIQFQEEAPRSSSIGRGNREVPFDDFKSTFINHLKIVEEESQRFPDQAP
jgi:CRISPR/Cas system CSM-associated protein Csm5 (group 7 of RAMP superfamily)